MKRNEVDNCLLCNGPIEEAITWKTLLTNAFPRTICLECEEKFECYENIEGEDYVALYKYNDHMKEFLHRYKFMHDVLLAKVFRQQIQDHLKGRKEIIVPVPMHAQKRKERTFAHVDELLNEAGISYTHMLEKTTTETQSSKSREERLNTPQIFRLKDGVTVRNKEILLVDDIYTTGTTINHAKRLLLDAGAKSVTAFTLIRG